MTTHINRLKCAISNTPGTSGALTIGAAASGFRTFGAAHDGMSVDCLLLDGAAWEVRTGCVYTHATTSLTRGTLEDSSTGVAINLTSATQVHVTASAAWGNALEMAMQAVTPGGRLTLESGVPISTTDQIGKTTIYYTPFVHNTVPLWDGAQWLPTTFAETSLALGTLTSGKPYDVFGYLSAGALAMEMLVWTDDTTRATAVTLQDGRYCKSSDKTRLLLGTFYTTSTTTTEDSNARRYVGNAANLVGRSISRLSGAASHSYSSSTYRTWNADDSLTSKVCTSVTTRAFGRAGCSCNSTAGWLNFLGAEASNSPSGTTFTIFVASPAVVDVGYRAMAPTERAYGAATFEWLLTYLLVDL